MKIKERKNISTRMELCSVGTGRNERKAVFSSRAVSVAPVNQSGGRA